MAFTPQEISQILEEFFNVVGARQYIGPRLVPIFGRKDESSIDWDGGLAPYEPLTVVLYQGNSYTSRQYVPTGVQITNDEYWAQTGNYNAQVEQYRQTVLLFDGRITDNANAITELDTSVDELQEILPASDFTAESTVKGYIDAKTTIVEKKPLKIITRPTQGKDSSDTGFFIIGFPKESYKLKFTNTNGNQYDAESNDSDVLSCAKSSTSGSYFINCTFFGYENSRRLNGNNYYNPDVTVAPGRRYMAFNTQEQTFDFYPLANNITNIPLSFDTAFEVGYTLIEDGVINSDITSRYRYPRNTLGWDDDYWYFFACEGRLPYNFGMSYAEEALFMLRNGITNAIELDGGGSTQHIVGHGDNAQKVNWYRDTSLTPYNLRKTPFALIVEPVDEPLPNERDILTYRNAPNGEMEFFYRANGYGALDPSITTYQDVAANSINSYDLALLPLAEDYVRESTLIHLPLPYTIYRFANRNFPIEGQVQFDLGTEPLASTLRLGVRVVLYNVTDDVAENTSIGYIYTVSPDESASNVQKRPVFPIFGSVSVPENTITTMKQYELRLQVATLNNTNRATFGTLPGTYLSYRKLPIELY